jgi:transcriptional regulator with XRE-family HTH domain
MVTVPAKLTTPADIRARLKRLMKQYDISQDELAGMCKVSRQAVRGWLAQGVVNAKHVATVARLLGVSVEALIVGMPIRKQLAKPPPPWFERHLTSSQRRLLLAFANESKERIQHLEDALDYIKKLCPVVTELQHKGARRKRVDKADADC